jgi:5-deoxy-glucuronate isomerase
MPLHIKESLKEKENLTVHPTLNASLSYFKQLRLSAHEVVSVQELDIELLCVILSGNVTISVGDQVFNSVGQRKDIWSGKADSVYAGTNKKITITAGAAPSEVAIAGALCKKSYEAFRITPDDVHMVDVGSVETHSRRRIFHILGQNAAGKAGNLLVSELYADPGCWSGYPPHKHDTERPPEETDFEEVYHYRFNPETGFGAQFCYDAIAMSQVVKTEHGDSFLVDKGYHPTVTSPGHSSYIFTILAGRHQRSLIQFFEPKHTHLMSKIPGIQAMRDKFK